MNFKKLLLPLFLIMLCFLSCKTYTVTPENFKKQVIENEGNTIELSKFKNTLYELDQLKFLTVYDKKGEVFQMQNSPSVEMRVTLKNKKRKIFYLNTLTLNNDTLSGYTSMILGLKNKVAFNDITKIEVQDGGKKFSTIKPTKDELILDHSILLLDNRGEKLEQFSFKMDTIHFDVAKFNSISFARGKFKNQPNTFAVVYYLNNSGIELINIREDNPKEVNGFWSTDLFVEKNSVFLERTAYYIDKMNSGLEKKHFKMSKSSQTAFIKKIVFELFNEIEANSKASN